MSYCYTHYRDYTSSCPGCRADRAHEDSQQIADLLSDISANNSVERLSAIEDAVSELGRKQANPGEYQCPECRYITLKDYASRCPVCYAGITDEYWTRVREREEKEKIRLAEVAKKKACLAKIVEAEARAKDESQDAFNGKIFLLMLVAFVMWLLYMYGCSEAEKKRSAGSALTGNSQQTINQPAKKDTLPERVVDLFR